MPDHKHIALVRLVATGKIIKVEESRAAEMIESGQATAHYTTAELDHGYTVRDSDSEHVCDHSGNKDTA